MRKICLLFLMLQSLGAWAQKESGYSLHCEGLPKGFAKTMPKEEKDSTAVIKEAEAILNNLKFEGYFYAEIANFSWTAKVLSVSFNAGERFVSTYLKNGNIDQSIVSDIKFREKLYQNQYFSLKEIAKLKEQLLQWYENHGYPFAAVWLDSLTIQNNTIGCAIFSDPGNKITIDTLQLVGSAKINQSFLQSYLGIKAKEPYSEAKIAAIDGRLKELTFLKPVKPTEVVFNSSTAKLHVFIDKLNANQFDGLIGFLPNPNTRKLQVTGDFKLQLLNALKQGELIGFNYRGLPQQTQELNLKFNYPYLFKTLLNLQTDFSFYKRDTSFLNVNARLALAYHYSTNKSIGFYFENFNGNVVDNEGNEGSNIGNVATKFYGLEGMVQHLDNALWPLSGFKIIAAFGAGRRSTKEVSLGIPIRENQFKLNTDIHYYLKISPRSVFYLHNLSAVLTGENLFDNEVFRLGGLKTFRGFDEQSILAKSFSVQTIEYRILVEERSFIHVFYDQGIVNKLVNKDSYIDYPLGFGAGFTFQTKAGLLSLTYALGKQKNNPLDLQKGKIHFGIVSYF